MRQNFSFLYQHGANVIGVFSLIGCLIVGQLMASTAQAAYTPPPNSYYFNTLGFYPRTSQLWYNGWADVDQHIDAFSKEKALATKYAPMVGTDPVLLVWWTYTETGKPGALYDSYNYDFCGGASQATKYSLTQNCADPNWGGWQIGYGHQFAMVGEWHLLYNAFKASHGDPTNAALVQKVGQNVLNQSGVKQTFPKMTIDQLVANTNTTRSVSGNYWAFVLMRDPDLSAYLLAKEIGEDIAGGKARGMNYRQVVASWGAGYYDANWQTFSNLLCDTLHLWKMLDAGQRP